MDERKTPDATNRRPFGWANTCGCIDVEQANTRTNAAKIAIINRFQNDCGKSWGIVILRA